MIESSIPSYKFNLEKLRYGKSTRVPQTGYKTGEVGAYSTGVRFVNLPAFVQEAIPVVLAAQEKGPIMVCETGATLTPIITKWNS